MIDIRLWIMRFGVFVIFLKGLVKIQKHEWSSLVSKLCLFKKISLALRLACLLNWRILSNLAK